MQPKRAQQASHFHLKNFELFLYTHNKNDAHNDRHRWKVVM
jgi:hypothetical protein